LFNYLNNSKYDDGRIGLTVSKTDEGQRSEGSGDNEESVKNAI